MSDTKDHSCLKYSRHHDLKIERAYLDQICSHRKRFEIRKDDRDFQVGDTMTLKAIDGGASVYCEIIYKSTYMQQEGYCVLGFTLGREK